ncbi:MAG TPA: hypothetical protein VJ728_02445 [Candidatus Binataceae bacterium]|nr:hypothetical protein [Candidatus Binataceae bacterium]
MTHDEQHHGTYWFAAFGKGPAASTRALLPALRRHEFVAFLGLAARRYCRIEIHSTFNNYIIRISTCSSLRAAARSSTWLGSHQQRAVRRRSFGKGDAVERAITRFLERWNQNANPFI